MGTERPPDPLEFLSGETARELLARVGRAATAPLSVHVYDGEHERERLAGCGGCAACAYVAKRPWGRQRCRLSRQEAGAAAIRRGMVAPFICHMGFSCVAAPLVLGDCRFAVTLGPFLPLEAPDRGVLASRALERLNALERRPLDELPFTVDDVPLLAAAAAPALAEWLAQTLALEWRQTLAESAVNIDEMTPEPPGVKKSPRKAKRITSDPYAAAEIAAALASGNQAQARALVRRALAEAFRGKTIEVKRARALAVVAAVLEAARAAGLSADPAWAKLPAFQDALAALDSDRDLARAAMKVLGPLKRASKRQPAAPEFAELDRLLQERLIEGITLNEAAAKLALGPTAITHRLQRKFGLSFTEYFGKMRVARAKELLARTQLTISEVARRVGLGDVSNFAKLFRRHEGLSPTEYRRKTKQR